MCHLKRLKINVFIIDTLKCLTQWSSTLWFPHATFAYIFCTCNFCIFSFIFILFMKTLHVFSFSKDWLIFNFHKKFPPDEGKKNQTLLWSTKILQEFTSKMIYQIQNIYKVRYSHYFLLTIVQNHTINFLGMVECMNMKL
jgi:hypothetical protein